MGKFCEKCGAEPIGYRLLDYCAECSRDLCDECMEKGCCGHVPAISGTAQDEEPPMDEGACDPLHGERMDSADMGEC